MQQEEAFLAALLKDIGMLVLDQVLGEEYGSAHGAAGRHAALVGSGTSQGILAWTHAEASGVLAEQWKLPPVLAMPMGIIIHRKKSPTIRSSRSPRSFPLPGAMSRCVCRGQADRGPLRRFERLVFDMLNLPEAECDALMNEIGTRTKEVAPLFDISMASSLGYEEILKRANETLVELTLQTQQRHQVVSSRPAHWPKRTRSSRGRQAPMP